MKLNVKLNLNSNSRVYCKFHFKSENPYQIVRLSHLKTEKQCRFDFAIKTN